MERYPFMRHRIVRTCTEKLAPYSKYRPYLEKDFHGRCCYCNMSEDLITAPFHVEHFIPQKIFEGKRDELLTNYENLMWSCPKCNLSKSDSYEGDFEHDKSITNTLYYNPVETNYNEVFYRNHMGSIQSDDPKGKSMIKQLKLYRPVHSAAWLLEEYEQLVESLEKKIAQETDDERKAIYEDAKGKIASMCVKQEKDFRRIYMGRTISYID